MPKRNYGFEKRQKELAKQEKRVAKQQRRLERLAEVEPPPGAGPSAPESPEDSE